MKQLTLRHVFLAVLAVSFVVFADAPATEPLPPDQSVVPFANDNHAFRYMLQEMKFVPVTSLQDLEVDPGKTIVIVFGETKVLQDIPQGLGTFVTQGGALLVASDRDSVPAMVPALGVRTVGERVLASEEHSYRKNDECPLLTEFNHSYALFDGIQNLATNRPGHLLLNQPKFFRGGDEYLQVPFPPACRIEGRKNLLRPCFAAVSEIPSKRVIVLADHSVFINSMMLQSDNDNFRFAHNCGKWLAENGKRDRVLFIDEGKLVTSFAVNVKETPKTPPLPRLPDPVDMLNQIIAACERENLFNRLLLEFVPRHRIVSGLTIVLTIVLLGYSLMRLLRARHDIETTG